MTPISRDPRCLRAHVPESEPAATNLNLGHRLSLLRLLGVVCFVAACTGSSPLPAPDEPAASGSGDTAAETTSAQREQTVAVVGATDVLDSSASGSDRWRLGVTDGP